MPSSIRFRPAETTTKPKYRLGPYLCVEAGNVYSVKTVWPGRIIKIPVQTNLSLVLYIANPHPLDGVERAPGLAHGALREKGSLDCPVVRVWTNGDLT